MVKWRRKRAAHKIVALCVSYFTGGILWQLILHFGVLLSIFDGLIIMFSLWLYHHYNATFRLQRVYNNKFWLNKIAARWLAKAIAQRFFFVNIKKQWQRHSTVVLFRDYEKHDRFFVGSIIDSNLTNFTTSFSVHTLCLTGIDAWCKNNI